MGNSDLLEGLERLRKENEQLKNLLAQYHISIPTRNISCPHTSVVQNITIESKDKQQPLLPLTPEEKIAIYQNLFRGRDDVFARRWYSTTTQKSGYQPVCLHEWKPQFCDKKKYKCANCPNQQLAPLTYQDIYRHLQGKDEYGRDVVGLYPICKDNTCYFLCADFDDKSCEHGYQNDVSAYISVCRDGGIPYSVERSRSGKGAHIWIFFESQTPAVKARKLGNAILSEAMNRNGKLSFRFYDRLFPNQDYISDGGFGNLVALPLQGKARRDGNSVFVDDTFIPYCDQWAYLRDVAKLPIDQERALSALSAHRTGVLSAATAFGKTVTTAALIAHRHTNTLILVLSKVLLSQWKTTLEKFLQIDYTAEDTAHKRGRKKVFSPIGTLSSDGNNLHGIMDIAVSWVKPMNKTMFFFSVIRNWQAN